MELTGSGAGQLRCGPGCHEDGARYHRHALAYAARNEESRMMAVNAIAHACRGQVPAWRDAEELHTKVTECAGRLAPRIAQECIDGIDMGQNVAPLRREPA